MTETAAAAEPTGYHCPACCPAAVAERRGYDAARALYEPRPRPPIVIKASGPEKLLWLLYTVLVVLFALRVLQKLAGGGEPPAPAKVKT